VEGAAGEARVDEFALEVEAFDEPWEPAESDAFAFSDGAEVEHEAGLRVEVGEGAAAEEDEAGDHEHAEGEEEPVAGGPEDEEACGESGQGGEGVEEDIADASEEGGDAEAAAEAAASEPAVEPHEGGEDAGEGEDGEEEVEETFEDVAAPEASCVVAEALALAHDVIEAALEGDAFGFTGIEFAAVFRGEFVEFAVEFGVGGGVGVLSDFGHGGVEACQGAFDLGDFAIAAGDGAAEFIEFPRLFHDVVEEVEGWPDDLAELFFEIDLFVGGGFGVLDAGDFEAEGGLEGLEGFEDGGGLAFEAGFFFGDGFRGGGEAFLEDGELGLEFGAAFEAIAEEDDAGSGEGGCGGVRGSGCLSGCERERAGESDGGDDESGEGPEHGLGGAGRVGPARPERVR
jgi:hypothetical protein